MMISMVGMMMMMMVVCILYCIVHKFDKENYDEWIIHKTLNWLQSS